jgi:hypothetical protein
MSRVPGTHGDSFALHPTPHKVSDATADTAEGTGKRVSDLRYLLSHEKALPSLFRYVAATNRFAKTHGDIDLPDQEDQETEE